MKIFLLVLLYKNANIIDNKTNSVITNVEIIFDYNTSLLNLDGDKNRSIGVIPPYGTHTEESVISPTDQHLCAWVVRISPLSHLLLRANQM